MQDANSFYFVHEYKSVSKLHAWLQVPDDKLKEPETSSLNKFNSNFIIQLPFHKLNCLVWLTKMSEFV